MKFAIVSKNNTQSIVETINMFGHDIDNKKPDFVITYGGDGAILFSERKYPGIPKITLRANSSIGFKCMYDENQLEDVIINIDNGEYKIKEEMKLEATFQGKKYLALNEVQIHNYSPIKAIRLSVFIEIDKGNTEIKKQPVCDNVISDGVVIATPFGSTAYYYSIGGEKFDKGVGITINNQSNPNKIRYKPIVIDEGFDSEIRIKIIRDDGLLLFDNDNNMIKVKGGDEILVKIAKTKAKFVVVS